MSLRTQLTSILPVLLPHRPEDAIKGTELIRLSRLQLDSDYSDASLRYHFSIMSCDPTSPIAKVEKGQGYYLRRGQVDAEEGGLRQASLLEGGDERGLTKRQKFQALVARYWEYHGRESFLVAGAVRDAWRFPKMVWVDWQMDGEETEESECELLRIKQKCGVAPFLIRAAHVELEARVENLREQFFQTLSATQWSNASELIFAAPVVDEAVAANLRKLGAQFGVSVTSLGLRLDDLENFPSAEVIARSSEQELEAIFSRLEIQRLVVGWPRAELDWEELGRLRAESPEIAECLRRVLVSLDQGSIARN